MPPCGRHHSRKSTYKLHDLASEQVGLRYVLILLLPGCRISCRGQNRGLGRSVIDGQLRHWSVHIGTESEPGGSSGLGAPFHLHPLWDVPFQSVDLRPKFCIIGLYDDPRHHHREVIAIDRIAREGVFFTDYYGQQSCTAGRAAFINGSVPVRTGMTKVGIPGAGRLAKNRRHHGHRHEESRLRDGPVRKEPPG